MLNRENPKSLNEALNLIKAHGWASVQQMADWAGVDDATVYAWLQAGGPEPKWNAIRLICRHCGDMRIQLALGNAFFSGTPVVCTPANRSAMPATAQGIKDGLIDSINELADFASKVKAALADGVICAKERTLLQAEAEQAKACIESVLQAINTMSEKRSIGPRLVGI